MKSLRGRYLMLLACVGAAGAGLVAVTTFNVPIRSVLIVAMIAACPLMHIFMGHGSHGPEASEVPELPKEPADSGPQIEREQQRLGGL